MTGVTEITILRDITLTGNVEVDLGTDKSNVIKVSGTATLDLGSYDLTINRTGTLTNVGYPGDKRNDASGEAASAIVIQDGANFSVKGTTGTIDYTWDPNSSNIKFKRARVSAAIQIGQRVGVYSPSEVATAYFNMESGNIESKTTAISMSDNANFNLNGGTITSTNSSGVYYGNASRGGGVMNINGGTLQTGEDSELAAIQVSGWVGDKKTANTVVNTGETVYTSSQAKPAVINVTGGTIAHKGEHGTTTKDGKTVIVENPNAICASGNVDLDISGGTITSTGTAVEIRAGSLNITGGNISSTAEQYLSEAKTGGSSYGVGVAIAQHSSKQNIDVNISGNANITGLNALGASNPMANGDLGTITATIDGGNFTSTKKSGTTATSGNAILADKTNITITVNNGNLNGNVTVTKKETASGTTDKTTDQAAVVLAGGTTTGTVSVVETDNSNNVTGTPTEDVGKAALKVMGGKVTDTTSANKYVADGSKVDANGNVTEDPDNGWSLTSANTYQYLLGGKTALLAASVGSGTIDSLKLKYDADNKFFGVPGEYNPTWQGTTDERKPYSLAKYTVASGAVTIQPEKPPEGYGYVKINGTGFIDNTIVTLEAAGTTESLGVYVDATDNRLANIKGGIGKDSIKAGDRRTTLDGGANDDTLDGGDDADTFVFTAGKDVINNYEYGTDTVNVADSLTPPISFADSLVSFDGSNFVFNFGNDNTLRFNNTAEVALHKGTNVYTYQGNTSGGINYMAHEGNGISLGGGYGDRFTGTLAANEEYKTIDAKRVNNAIRIIGNDKDNFIVASSIGGGTLEGGAGNDTLMAVTGSASTASLRFEGGAGADSMVGGNGYNLFIYTEGADSIKGYNDGKDLVTVRGSIANLEKATFALTGTENKDIKLSFESDDDNLTFEGGATLTNAISIQSGNNVYAYKKDRVARNEEAITLTSGLASSVSTFGPDVYDTVNAVDVGHAISIIGNDNANVLYGSSLGGSLSGGAGKDKLDVTDRAATANFVFQYTAGKDTVEGFDANKDKLDMTAARLGDITKAKSSKNDTRLAFTFDKSDVLTFKSEDEIGRVSLNGDSGFLTKDGIVSVGTSNSLDLFASARGKIDLTDTLYSIDGGIKSVDASDVKKQNVTIIGSSVDAAYTFAGKNRKKDQFEYNGGNVTISGYEAGVDKFDFNTAELGSFSVGANGGNVSLSAGNDYTVVLESLQGQEVLLHHAGSTRSSFTKMVFKQDGVILNKSKRPTMATVSASYDASGDSTVKKILVTDDIAAGASIVAGAKAKTTIDASAANGVTLVGGAKNDKLIGSTVAADNFVYTAGKDIIENYGSSDQISLGGGLSTDDLFTSKISAGKRSIKFKFNNKSALTIKPAKGSNMGDTLNFSDVPNYTYSKNAIASGTNATLTSAFSGSYKLKDKAVSVDGSRVEKNLTYKGTSDAETLTGGTKKTTFKGGGGNDSLKGGSGKDIFFYAKGNSGNTTIADFDFTSDKVKIASGTITDISTVSGGIKFDMNSGRKGSANIGSFQINSSATYGTNGKTGTAIDTTKTLIKANNTYLWFADEGGTDVNGNSFASGALITSDKKISKSAVGNDCAVIDLGYSTNLVKAGVAYKVENATWSSGSTNNQTNNSEN